MTDSMRSRLTGENCRDVEVPVLVGALVGRRLGVECRYERVFAAVPAGEEVVAQDAGRVRLGHDA